ncbi:MAG: DUF2849 domain-containing protein [Maritimibacter sp.]|nr:DUF2849 domain-containing protein [Maritimibacter sp.]
MSRPEPAQFVTANDLLTGEVVFLAADGRWVAELDEAALVADAEENARRLAWAQADEGRVVGAYLARAAAGASPLHFREQFRATGPSNYFHGKQERRAHV